VLSFVNQNPVSCSNACDSKLDLHKVHYWKYLKCSCAFTMADLLQEVDGKVSGSGPSSAL
jgi:hypothetical protein